jgi:uncharacterized protein YjbI with pentapeptide repeats
MSHTKIYGNILTNADLTKENLKSARLINITINENTHLKDCNIINSEVANWIDFNTQFVSRQRIQKYFSTLDVAKTNKLLEQMHEQGWQKSDTRI